MEKFVDKKLARVTSGGPILPLGGIYGPTLPQVMSTHILAVLIQKGYKVAEILGDGTEIELNLANYNVDLKGDNGDSLKNVSKPNEEVQIIDTKKKDEKLPNVVEEIVTESYTEPVITIEEPVIETSNEEIPHEETQKKDQEFVPDELIDKY